MSLTWLSCPLFSVQYTKYYLALCRDCAEHDYPAQLTLQALSKPILSPAVHDILLQSLSTTLDILRHKLLRLSPDHQPGQVTLDAEDTENLTKCLEAAAVLSVHKDTSNHIPTSNDIINKIPSHTLLHQLTSLYDSTICANLLPPLRALHQALELCYGLHLAWQKNRRVLAAVAPSHALSSLLEILLPPLYQRYARFHSVYEQSTQVLFRLYDLYVQRHEEEAEEMRKLAVAQWLQDEAQRQLQQQQQRVLLVGQASVSSLPLQLQREDRDRIASSGESQDTPVDQNQSKNDIDGHMDTGLEVEATTCTAVMASVTSANVISTTPIPPMAEIAAADEFSAPQGATINLHPSTSSMSEAVALTVVPTAEPPAPRPSIPSFPKPTLQQQLLPTTTTATMPNAASITTASTTQLSDSIASATVAVGTMPSTSAVSAIAALVGLFAPPAKANSIMSSASGATANNNSNAAAANTTSTVSSTTATSGAKRGRPSAASLAAQQASGTEPPAKTPRLSIAPSAKSSSVGATGTGGGHPLSQDAFVSLGAMEVVEEIEGAFSGFTEEETPETML